MNAAHLLLLLLTGLIAFLGFRRVQPWHRILLGTPLLLFSVYALLTDGEIVAGVALLALCAYALAHYVRASTV